MNKQSILFSFITLIAITLLFTSCDKSKTYYHPNGEISAKIPLSNGEYNGTAYYYFDNGKVQMILDFVNGEVDGMGTYYNRKHGFVERTEHYSHGLLNGEVKTFDKRNTLLTLAEYRNDTLNGIYEEYYANGALKIKGGYKAGLFHGHWSYWTNDGMMIGKGEFSEGTGTQRKWYATGELLMKQQFRKNQHYGEEIWYNPDGSVLKRTDNTSGNKQENK